MSLLMNYDQKQIPPKFQILDLSLKFGMLLFFVILLSYPTYSPLLTEIRPFIPSIFVNQPSNCPTIASHFLDLWKPHTTILLFFYLLQDLLALFEALLKKTKAHSLLDSLLLLTAVFQQLFFDNFFLEFISHKPKNLKT